LLNFFAYLPITYVDIGLSRFVLAYPTCFP
jgi:hypothetical protein